MVPELKHLLDELPETYGNASATEKGEKGNFLPFDLRSGAARWKTPPSKRMRISLKLQCALLTTDIIYKEFKEAAAT